MTKKPIVGLTANFERNLSNIESFLTEVEAPQAYDALLDELLNKVIPNLERFPGMGRPFLANVPQSVEATNSIESLKAKLLALKIDLDALREYILADYLVLYVQMKEDLYLLAVKHQRQLTFDFESHWGMRT